MKLIRESAYQFLVLAAALGLVFVAYDLSCSLSAAKVFYSFSRVIPSSDANINYMAKIVLPFVIYLLSCGGFMFLILENIRLWRSMSFITPANKLLWTLWIGILALMCLLPVYLGTSLIFEGLWYIFVIILILCLLYFACWASRS
jgi:hypothetical protein